MGLRLAEMAWACAWPSQLLGGFMDVSAARVGTLKEGQKGTGSHSLTCAWLRGRGPPPPPQPHECAAAVQAGMQAALRAAAYASKQLADSKAYTKECILVVPLKVLKAERGGKVRRQALSLCSLVQYI